MKRLVPHICLCLLAPFCAIAGESIKGAIVDPSGAPIAGAQVAALSRTGVVDERATNASGEFDLPLPDRRDLKLVVTADGFQTRTIDLPAPRTIELQLAPRTDSIRVAGSAIDVPASEFGTSVSVISNAELRQRNEPQAIDLLRYLPGLAVTQSGQRGGVASLSIRGGDSKYNLVQIDGSPVNSFNFGGYFDFAQIPTDFLERIEVARGPQSAVYGSYANSGVVNFVTRTPEESPALEIVAEGGSHQEHRFAVAGSALVRGFGITGSASRLDDNGPVPNSDYRNENLYLHLDRKWGKQALFATGNFNSNETGVPGPYGSNPAGIFTGIDLVSRSKNDFSDYLLHYQADVSNRVREELFGSFFLNNSPYLSPYGSSFNKDIRAQGETRTVVNVSRQYTFAAGFAYSREEVKNTYVTDASRRTFPLRRDQEGIYWENRLQFGNRLFVNAGLRAEVFDTPFIPAAPTSVYGPTRPEIRSYTLTQVNPKVAIAYALPGETRLHASFGTGIRPPGGSDLAFTTNPSLKPERTRSFDAGIDGRLLRNRVSLGATYFHNRYSDLIVGLGGSLRNLSRFTTDNLSNAQSQGAEFEAQFRPARWFSIAGNYTYLDTKVLALNGSGLAQRFYTPGQPLLRRPKHSGSMVSTFTYKRVSANVVGYFRGNTLDKEPNYGESVGFFVDPGYQNIGVNVNYALGQGVAIYGNLRNALNQRYEEVYGYPSPLLNFVAGIKWSLRGKRL